MSRKFQNRICLIVNKGGSIIVLISGIIVFFSLTIFKIGYSFRLDQYASTISGTIIGVIGTMFGLTAASYAFIWGELKSEGKTNFKIRHILEKYKSELWRLFFNALVFSFAIVIINLIILGLIQNITNDTLSHSVYKNKDVIINTYYNDKHDIITSVILIDLIFSILDVLLMGNLNYKIFYRNRSYEKIAYETLKRLSYEYNLELPKKIREDRGQVDGKAYNYSVEFNKIHYIELLMRRIFTNHESEGDAYNRIYKEDELFKQIMKSKFDKNNHK